MDEECNYMFLRKVEILEEKRTKQFPFTIPTIHSLKELYFDQRVTFFVGENGSGKSTLLEAIAEKSDFHVAGGGRSNLYEVHKADSVLAPFIRLSWSPKTWRGFFLRAESFYQFASHIDSDPDHLNAYGGKSLHDQSHGESFMSLFQNRFGSDAIYLLDEPEAALSPQRQLAFLNIMYELAERENCQFIIATHSPILLGYPGAAIFTFDGDEIEPIRYEETSHYAITKSFLNDRTYFLRKLLEDELEN